MNLPLKVELIRKFGTQISAAKKLGIRENRLSYIVRGHAEPSKSEREALERGLGRERVRKMLKGSAQATEGRMAE